MSRRGRPLDIAIVGMGCRFPGAADLFAYWANILANRDQTREVPANRWPIDIFYDPDSKANDRVACRRGGYLDSPVPFNPAEHGIMPLAVDGGEPEQFLVLDAARAALADAGLDADRLDGLRVEVVVGRGNYFNRGNLTRLQHGRIVAQTAGLLAALHPEWSADDVELLRQDLKSSLPPFEAATIPGQLTSATAGRLADRLNLTGASLVVDAASASSLAALDLGRRALGEGRADLALIGGVYIEADVDFPLVFSRLGALSKTGAARSFSTDADGLVSGEGVGVVVLKRLRDAERAGDRIYAVVKGVGLASDGRSRGLAAPSARGHALAMRRALRAARVDSATVDLIEGHGLGVPASDRAELRALRAVYPKRVDSSRVLGAVASQIGHAMPAAGMAGLIKTALSLHHRILPPTLHAENPHRMAVEGGFELLPTPRPWIHDNPDIPRRAGVSAFGFAGVNAHAVLEEHAASADRIAPGAMLTWDSEAFLLAADSRPALADRVRELREQLSAWSESGLALKDLAFTLNTERAPADGRVRLGLVAGTFGELLGRLEAVEPLLRDASRRLIRDARGVYYWDEPVGRDGEKTLAFLFAGEGSQYPGMLADLCFHFPELRIEIEKADRITRETADGPPASRCLFGGSTNAPNALWTADKAVTAVLASQWGMFQILTRLGLNPDAVAGHSSGELPALAAAGALATEESLDLALGRLAAVFRRLEAEDEIPRASLVAIGADRSRVESTIRATGSSAVVAIDNCPRQVVLAGPPDEADRIVAMLRAEGVVCEVLPFNRAYHTPAFEAVMAPLRAFYEGLDLHRPNRHVYSCSTAGRMPDDPEAIRRLAAGQWTRRVAFRETIEAMSRDGLRVFVDLGARGSLCGYVDDILRGKPAFAVAANLPRRSGTTQLNHLVASLFAQGISIEPSYLYARRRPRRIDLSQPPAGKDATAGLSLGFPEMRLSEGVLARLGRPGREPVEHHQTSPIPARPNGEIQAVESEADAAMLNHLSTMNAFLKTQGEVLAAFLAANGSDLEVDVVPAPATFPVPGPWAGEIQSGEPGRWVSTEYYLNPITDPIALHHTLGGRRISALATDRLGLPVLPFFTMVEMAAQVASLVVPAGLTLTSLEGARAHKWVEYEPDSLVAMTAERDLHDPNAVRVALRQQRQTDEGESRIVFETVAHFAESAVDCDAPRPFVPSEPRPSKFTASRLYDEQWLFHGPAMRPLTEIGPVGREGISGTLEVQPLVPLTSDGNEGAFLTDVVVLDGFTQLLGCWGLDMLQGGDVIFPLQMSNLKIHGERPQVGTTIECRVHVTEVEWHRIRVDAELIRPDGRVWMRIEDWEDWRFHWPARYRDVFRAPDEILVGEPLPLDGLAPGEAAAVWLAPPADMGRPVWRNVLERVQLSPDEWTEHVARVDSETERAHRLWERIAAKEAARRTWLARGEPPCFPADLAVSVEHGERRRVHKLAHPNHDARPVVSIARADGVVVALAATDPRARPGVGVVFLNDLHHEDEITSRTLAARIAAAGSLAIAPDQVDSVRVDPSTGIAIIRVEGHPEMKARTERRNDYIWAWVLRMEV